MKKKEKKMDISSMLREVVSKSNEKTASLKKPITIETFEKKDSTGEKPFSAIKVPKAWKITKEKLSDWSSRDFAIYISQKYKKKYNEDWGLNGLAVVSNIAYIKEAVKNLQGFCDNIVFKDFLDFYFDKWIDLFRFKKGTNWFNAMKKTEVVEDFCRVYIYNSQNVKQEYDTLDGAMVELDEKEKEDIESSYVLGLGIMIINHGVYETFDFLNKKKGWTEELCVEKISTIAKEYHSKPVWGVIKVKSLLSKHKNKKLQEKIQELLEKE
jgi:hypothetical protein